MGLLRIILAIAVVVAHVEPFLGLRFFGGGVMAVECFFIISGFYMALILEKRYCGKMGSFYINRFWRLFPTYWMLLAILLVTSFASWLVTGHPLGAITNWMSGNHTRLGLLWALVSNATIVGCDMASLFAHEGIGASEDGAFPLLLIPATWSLSVEIVFYAIAPWLLRLSKLRQVLCFLVAIIIRCAIWYLVGQQWSPWLYFFAPASWVFFLGGVLAHHLMIQMIEKPWFKNHARSLGVALAAFLSGVVALYVELGIFEFQDWRFYTCFGLSLPFVFQAFKDSKFDALIGDWSYPLYLGHAVVLAGIYTPLLGVVPEKFTVYAVLATCALLIAFVQFWDKKLQKRFKRLV